MGNISEKTITKDIEKIEFWKKNILYPFLDDVHTYSQVKIKEMFVGTYDILQHKYNFNMKLLQNKFNKRYGGAIEDSGVNIIAHKEEYQDLFISALNEYIQKRLIGMGENIVWHQRAIESVERRQETLSKYLEVDFADRILEIKKGMINTNEYNNGM